MRQAALLSFAALLSAAQATPQGKWQELFDGKDLTGWQVNEHKDTFSVENGAIRAHGERSHCFYTGPYMNHMFKDFELEVEVKTLPHANGGIYIDTQFQPEGWPGKGFEVQVNNTYPNDPRKTGSLYEVQDNNANVAPDNQWFTEHIVQRGDKITVDVNGKEIVSWTQPSGWAGVKEFPGRKIGIGTIALQGHDSGSTVYYRHIRIRSLTGEPGVIDDRVQPPLN